MPHAVTRSRGLGARLARFARSALAGGLATLVDLGVLGLLVSGFGVPARVANVPALVAGGVVNFVGNRTYAFRATGDLARQAALYTLVEIVALALNGILFELGMRALAAGACAGAFAGAYLPLRLVTSNLVFVFFSYPLWRRVFRAPAPA